ncbi:hypothetical protein EST38_g7706 [Candolleomyces aberdarensis]|uniref:U6 small nuclear RNA (adenine-(43)-N(6))-methyltransferase n=1 Tax=Candolleomyces aberdarensis TaxID=2316362 RepID=A0A4Q2DGG2_9AGAR|nr:hypothetical protein EST38_g7706 [Candolleomyces aberdarensis]
MHPRNPYRQRIDFVELSRQYHELKPYVNTHTKTIDFRDDDAQRALTRAILKVDFGLEVDLPNDRLCPPVPNRLNYVLWIQDIVETTGRAGYSGTGASAIYPLLACKSNSEWEMVATEIDSTSLSCAQSNVSRNGLQDKIHVVQASSGSGSKIFGPLFDASSSPNTAVFDFTMCNPPFYSSHTEIQQSQLAKEELPLQACSGSENEMIYPADPEAEDGNLAGSGAAGKGGRRLASVYMKEGGEAAFVARMVEESTWLGAGKCRWYTSMLGKLSSVPKLVDLLREFNIINYAITEFVQGQTRRWALGWSLDGWRLPDTIARLSHLAPTHPLYKVQPQKTTLEYKLPSPPLAPPSLPTALDTDPTGAAVRAEKGKTWTHTLERVLFGMQDDTGDTSVVRVEKRGNVHFVLDAAATSPSSDAESSSTTSVSFRVSVKENTWSRSARRKLKRKRGGEADHEREHDGGAVPTLATNMSLNTEQTKKKSKVCNEPLPNSELQSPTQAVGASTSTPPGPPPRSLEKADDSDPGAHYLVDVQEYKMVCCIELVPPSSISCLPSSSRQGRDEGEEADPDQAASDVHDSMDRNGVFNARDSTELRNAQPCVLRFQWVYGFDRQMFEGFVSHVGRKVQQGSG